MSGKGWWFHATAEQRLAQIDGGIECGLTGSQIALALGGNAVGVRQFAWAHDRKLGRGGEKASRPRRAAADITRAKLAFLRGDRVDFFGAAPAGDDFRLDQVEV